MSRDGAAAAACCRVVACALTVSALLTSAPAAMVAQGPPQHGLEEMTWQPTLFVLFDQFEYASAASERPVAVAMQSWYGNAMRRMWLRAQAEQSTIDAAGEGEAELFYGRLVDPFWDAVIGVRVDGGWRGGGATRVHAAFGFIGLAPYRFELSPTLYVSTKGDVSARLEAAYQLLLTQRLIAEPEFELNAGLQAVPDAGLGRGLHDYEAGIRIRYEFMREFGPYVGWSWMRRLGGTATMARTGAEPVSESSFVFGVRVWR